MAPPLCTASRRAEWAVLALILIACGGVIFGGGGTGPFFRREATGYYGLLTDGFRDGHLYVKLQPHPGLLALSNPYDPVANAPYRVHDMSLYRGHYYLYFGVTPVLIFFWPVGELTGWFPTERCAIAVFCWLGIATATLLLAAIRRRHFPRASLWALALGVLCLALADPALGLTTDATFYNVPIACAFCLNLFLFATVYRAAYSARHQAAWIAVASGCFGLVIGARPDYLLTGVALLAPLLWLLHQAPGSAGTARGKCMGLAIAALAPALLCGVGLGAYNRLRFGSFTEFGMRYQLAGNSFVDFKTFGWGNIWPNGIQYLFAKGAWERYFPFFSPTASVGWGFLRYTPWAWLGILAFLPADPAEAGDRNGRRFMAMTVALGSTANLLLLSSFFGSTPRYQADYAPGFILLAGIGALALASRLAVRSEKNGWVFIPLTAIALFSVSFNVLGLAGSKVMADAPNALARLADRPVALWERLRGTRYGPLQLKLELPVARDGQAAEPLFETGLTADRRDWLQISYLAGNQARLGFFHAGTGLVQGRPFAIPSNRILTVEAQCGSLLPPYAHPIFSGWSVDDYIDASRRLRVSVNGVDVLDGAVGCYLSAPDDLRLGASRWGNGGMVRRFTGRIIQAIRLPLAPPFGKRPGLEQRGPVELRVVFPADRVSGMEPLLSTGSGLKGDLVYCVYEGLGRMRLALDHSDSGGPRGEIFSYDPGRSYLLQIWMGSLASSGAVSPDEVPLERRIFVRVDGVAALDAVAGFNSALPATAVAGRSPFSSTVVSARFSGSVLQFSSGQNLPHPPPLISGGKYGSVDLKVLFPVQALGTAEPLVVTGTTGAGDILYVKYVDPTHLSFGFDHWGVGGFSSPAVEIDYAKPHRLEIRMDSLFRPSSVASENKLVRVKLDGAAVFTGNSACHPSKLEEIQIGKNPIGGSTCGPVFTGRILQLSRPPISGG